MLGERERATMSMIFDMRSGLGWKEDRTHA